MGRFKCLAVLSFILAVTFLSIALKFRIYIHLPTLNRDCTSDSSYILSEQSVSIVTDPLAQLVKIDIEQMEQRLEAQQMAIRDMEERNGQLMRQLEPMNANVESNSDGSYTLLSTIPIISPDVVRSLNIHQKSEFELIPFVSFTKDRLYQLEPGLTHRPEDIPRGDRKSEMDEVIETAIQLLNKASEVNSRSFSVKDLVDGSLRTDHVLGTQYELFFSSSVKSIFHHLTLFRPFAKVQKVKTEVIDKSNEWINLIVPLAQRVDTFKQFMETFAKVCILGDQRVHLTIVYFGEDELNMAQKIVKNVSQAYNFTHVTFLMKDTEFSRGVGLLSGAEAWDKGNVLMFFCDVDIYFDERFLDRCRMNAEPGRKVYYPIVFSLYNPDIVYHGRNIPDWHDQLVIGKNSGYWRDFGFGMTCLYRSDFLYMKGFDTNIKGWGAEDVKLYRKFVSSNLEVVRAPDRVDVDHDNELHSASPTLKWIFHLYHPKHCDIALSRDQYKMCLGSKALSEASTNQLGLLAFKELQKQHEEYHKNKSLNDES